MVVVSRRTHPGTDAVAIVADDIDPTKKVRVEAAAIATGTTRVLTMPDEDIDLTPGSGNYAALLHALAHVSGGADIIRDATAALDGLMTAAFAAKLDGIAALAEVNPDLISQAEAEAGTATTERIFSALRVAQAIAALGNGGGLIKGAGPTLVIASGSITPTHSFHLVDTEGAGAADDLDTIVGTNALPGNPLVLMQVDDARDVTAKNGTGNLTNESSGDLGLVNTTRMLVCHWNGTKWGVERFTG